MVQTRGGLSSFPLGGAPLVGGTEHVLRSHGPWLASSLSSWAPISLSFGARRPAGEGMRETVHGWDQLSCPKLLSGAPSHSQVLPKRGSPEASAGLHSEAGVQPVHWMEWWKGPPGFLDSRQGQWVRQL